MEKEVPKGWVETTLGESFKIERGGSPRPIENYITENDNGINWIKIGDTKNVNKYIHRTKEKIKPEGLKKSRMVYEDDFILSNSMSFGRPYIMKTNGCIHDGWLVIRKNEDVDNNFLYYLLTSNLVYRQFSDLAKGSTVKNLNIQAVQKVKINIPPISVQLQIGKKLDQIFSNLETAKKGLEKIPVLLKQFRQAVLTQAVTGKLTEEWREGKELDDVNKWMRKVIEERNLDENTKRKIEYAEITCDSNIPESWSFGYLQYFGEFTRGKSKHRPRNDKKLFGGEFPFIQTGEVSRSNGIIKEFSNTYSAFGLSQSRLFPKGTLCITIAANIAETGILGFDACFPDSVVGYIPFKDYYSSKFAMYCLMTMQKDLEHYAPSTAQKNINLGILFEIPFPVPTKEEQTEIVSRVEALFAKVDAIEAQYKVLKEKIDNLPQAVLAKAFRGEL